MRPDLGCDQSTVYVAYLSTRVLTLRILTYSPDRLCLLAGMQAFEAEQCSTRCLFGNLCLQQRARLLKVAQAECLFVVTMQDSDKEARTPVSSCKETKKAPPVSPLGLSCRLRSVSATS